MFVKGLGHLEGLTLHLGTVYSTSDLLEVTSSPSVELIYFVQCTIQYTMKCRVRPSKCPKPYTNIISGEN